MKMFDVQIALEGIAEARSKWDTALRKFNADVEFLMARLLNEAAVNHMSVEQVAKASGLTAKRVRVMMRAHGLDPKKGKRLLANHAAQALAENAALLGVEPHEMDLTSPLAYLPMGSDLKKFLETETSQGVKELPEDEREALADAIYDAMPWEGATYEAAAESIAGSLLAAGFGRTVDL
jgi:hypothetical protein